MMTLRPIKESPRTDFPEHLKHADVLGDTSHQLKLTASNSLFHAVLKGRVQGVRFLLNRGVTVNGKNDYGYSILVAALHIDDAKKRDKMFSLLMDRNADAFFKDATHQRTVLQWACILGRVEQVKTILDELGGEIDLNYKDTDGHTALHHAVMAGNMNIVQVLVDMYRKFGVNVDVPDKLGLTPYLHAKRLGYRDVAECLRTQGLASQGHGDMLFRSPREWSQIGKFERKKAIEIHTQEAINLAKIQGKITRVRDLENGGPYVSPRMAVPPILLPSYNPSRDVGVRLAARYKDRLSTSLPSLSQDDSPTAHDGRPSSANGAAGHDNTDGAQAGGMKGRHRAAGAGASHADRPRAPRLAFAQGDSAVDGNGSHVPTGAGGGGSVAAIAGVPWEGAAGASIPHGKGTGSNTAFNLMEMHGEGRMARQFHKSEFDTSKAREYGHMLGNLNAIMDVLSQQQSKSFRQSVRYERPVTPKKKKPKKNVSTLAIIFGRDKSGRKTRKHSSKASAKKGQKGASTKKKESGEEEKKGKASEKKKKSSVPHIKVNDKPV
nr:hypothetical protein BaRGS_032659 [Batillaria attramentaria]